MKLTVNHGVSADKALEYIKKIINEQYGDYPVLKGNLNMYITLKDDENRSCPDNEKEYILSAEKIVDVEKEKILQKRDELFAGWKKFISVQYKNVHKNQSEVDFAQSSLEMAIKKGLKEKTIAQRTAYLEACKENLTESKKYAELIYVLDNRFAAGDYKLRIAQTRNKSSSYTYTLDAYLVFKNVNGKDYHFAGYESRFKTPYGSLRNGLPYGWTSKTNPDNLSNE